MRGAVLVTLVLTSSVLPLSPAKPASSLAAQTTSGASRGSTLPPDVDPVSRNRLPPSAAGVEGAAAIRLHVSSPNVRWASPLGRALTELAILTTAREHIDGGLPKVDRHLPHRLYGVYDEVRPSLARCSRQSSQINGVAVAELYQ